ncbi:MAG: hypothetical protein AB8B91_23580, partial [Rubripirellula sp.]
MSFSQPNRKQESRRALNVCSDALQVLLALSRTIISHRELPVLMRELVDELRKVATFDYLAILLCDESSDSLVAHILEPAEFAKEARKVKATIDGSPAGHAWKTQEP